MTEVQDRGSKKGLFATKKYAKGDLIFEEEPVTTLAPISDDESSSFMMEITGDKKSKDTNTATRSSAALWNAIQVPISISTGETFRGLVQAGMCWQKRQFKLSKKEKKLALSLYHPSKESASSDEKAVLGLASQAVAYLKGQEKKLYEDFQDWETLERVMLIWACNSFEGGRIYPKISRVNHSCNPTAVIQADGEKQRLVAATTIAPGAEISISYLGLLLYADTGVRKEKLQTSKFFDCQCERCGNPNDTAGRMPCPTCHPREVPQQSLDEDVQYDDDEGVQYVVPGGTCSKCKCKSEDKKLEIVMENVSSKVVAFLDAQKNNKSVSNEADDEEDTILEEQVGLASAIMGDRHWTTNLLKLLHLDRRLSLMAQAMLTKQELPEMDDIAEAIDSLQRVQRFFESLNLDLDDGHVLCDVTIGVARTLVSLGDVKSQKYGAEWMDKIAEYAKKFESEGKQKVVAALKVAWKKHDGELGGEPPVKKPKPN